MPTTRTASQFRKHLIDALKEDHKRVKAAYREFQKLGDEPDSADRCEEIVREVTEDLLRHATLEEELLYPFARESVEASLIDEAEVEHESTRELIMQLRDMDRNDDKFSARFTVLCEYVMHHVKEEEKELFPQLEAARGLDWETLASSMDARRAELEGRSEDDEGSADGETDENRESRKSERSQSGEMASGRTSGRRADA